MSKKALIILSIVAAIIVIVAVGYGIHHLMTNQMPGQM